MEARMSGQELEENLDIICYYFILQPGYLRHQEMKFHPQIPTVESLVLSPLTCFITTWFGRVGS